MDDTGDAYVRSRACTDCDSLLARLNKLQADTYTVQSAVAHEKRIASLLERCGTLIETVHQGDAKLQSDMAMFYDVDASGSESSSDVCYNTSPCHDQPGVSSASSERQFAPAHICDVIDADTCAADITTGDVSQHSTLLCCAADDSNGISSNDEMAAFVTTWLKLLSGKSDTHHYEGRDEVSKGTAIVPSSPSRLASEAENGYDYETLKKTESEVDANCRRAATHLLIRCGITTTLTNTSALACASLAGYCDRVQTSRDKLDRLTASVRQSCWMVVRHFAAQRLHVINTLRITRMINLLDSSNSAQALMFWRDLETVWSETLCSVCASNDEQLVAQRQRSQYDNLILALLQRPHPVATWRRLCRSKWHTTLLPPGENERRHFLSQRILSQ